MKIAKKTAPYIILFVYSQIMALGLCRSAIFSEISQWTDSAVFQYIAKETLAGNMPYLDTFDHKGPLIYFINVLAELISPTYGLFILESITIVSTTFIMYRIAKLYSNTVISIASSCLAIICLIKYLECGNFVEEYAMPMIAYAVYVFLLYFKNGNVSVSKIILCGIGFGGTLMLRPNMVVVWAVGALLVLIQFIAEKKKNILRLIISFSVGTLMSVIPFIIWLSVNNALPSFIDAYLVFNFKYTADAGIIDIVKTAILLFISYTIFCAVVSSLVMIKFDKSYSSYFIILSMLLSVVSVCISGRVYYHYVLVIIPILAYPISYALNFICSKCSSDKKIIELVLVALLLSGIAADSLKITYTVALNFKRETEYYWEYDLGAPCEKDTYDTTYELAEIAKKYSSDDDKITVYGNNNSVYLLSNRMSASRYSYQFPIGDVQPEIMQEYFSELEKNKPKVIVWDPIMPSNDDMQDFITKHNYKQASENDRVYYLE